MISGRILRLLLFLATILVSSGSYAQLGGRYTYGFLGLTSAARSAALSGNVIAVNNPDLSMTFENPALLDSTMGRQISLSYVNYFADINYGQAAYAMNTSRLGTFSARIFYLNYGDFIEANEYGEITGTFKAAEYNLGISWGLRLDSAFTVGLSVKPVYSVFERYSSWGIAGDVALLYRSQQNRFSAGLVARNIGTQLTTYDNPDREPIPFEILAGFNYKIQYAPFNIFVNLNHLEKYDLDVILPGDVTDPATGEKVYNNRFQETALKALDHVGLGVEFVPGKAINFRFGYNFRRRAELKLGTKNTASGMSFGLGLKLKNFRLDYSLASYHVSGASHLLTITTDLDDF
jgi:hypothetical protein